MCADWNTHYAALLHYCRAYGDCKVPRRLCYTCELPKSSGAGQGEEGRIAYSGKLGRWLDDQRKAHKGKRLRLQPEREALLQQLVDEGV